MGRDYRERPYRERGVAIFLALFLGSFGVHHFYLGQIGRGVLFCIFSFTGIPFILGLVQGLLMLVRSQEDFDEKYNPHYFYSQYNRSPRYQMSYERQRSPNKPFEKNKPTKPEKSTPVEKNSFRATGMAKFKDYDYDGAIEDFQKAIQANPKDVACHFNLACAYSLTEKKELAFTHLAKAVENGFVDFEKIKTHDAFSYLRIQNEFAAFAESGYRVVPNENKTTTNNPLESMDLLEQIQRLAELRERGLLTDEEFSIQKKKILG